MGLHRVAASWSDVPAWGAACVVLLHLVCVAISAAKWRMVIPPTNRPTYPWLFGSYLSGTFAGNLLPTAVGGDALRILQLRRRIGSAGEAAASVFLERLTGFLALNLLALLGAFYLARQGSPLRAPVGVMLVVAASALAALCIGSLMVLEKPASLGRLALRILPAPATAPGQRTLATLAAVLPSGRTMAVVLLLSVVFQCLWATMHAVAGLALGLGVPLALYVVLATATDLLGLVPVFFNNLGAREFVFVTVLSQFGVPDERALAAAFLVLTARLVVSALGGLAYPMLARLDPTAATPDPDVLDR